MAEVGVSIQHDANHGAYSRNTSLEYLLGTTLDIVGASSFMWKQQHVVGHHTYTNVDGLDPDIRVKDPDVRRVSQHQPWQSYQVFFFHFFTMACNLCSCLTTSQVASVPDQPQSIALLPRKQCLTVKFLTSWKIIIALTIPDAGSLHAYSAMSQLLVSCLTTSGSCNLCSNSHLLLARELLQTFQPFDCV